MENNRQYQLKCQHCGNEFTEQFDVLGYNYTTDACCPKCGNFTKLEFDAQGNMVSDEQEDQDKKDENVMAIYREIRELEKQFNEKGTPEERVDIFTQIKALKNQQHKKVIGSIVSILKKEELTINEAITLLDDTKSVILQTIFK